MSAASLWARFQTDALTADSPVARSLITLAKFLEDNPQLPAAYVAVFPTGSAHVQFTLRDAAMDERVTAVDFVAEQLGATAKLSVLSDEGGAQYSAEAKVGDGTRTVTVYTATAKPAWTAVAA